MTYLWLQLYIAPKDCNEGLEFSFWKLLVIISKTDSVMVLNPRL